MMLTPWGASQSEQTFGPGLVWVSTSSHGGLGVPILLAKDLSDYAWGIALEYTRAPLAGFLWFEEDCSFNAVFAERPEWARLDLAKNLAAWRASTSSYLDPDEVQQRIVGIAARLSLPDDQLAALYARERDRYSAPKRARLERDGAAGKERARSANLRAYRAKVAERAPLSSAAYEGIEASGAFDGFTVTSDADPGL